MKYHNPDFNFQKEFSDLQKFQYLDKYSKFLWNEQRRETWVETVTRTVDFLVELSEEKLHPQYYQEIFNLIYKGEIAPSMRLFATAGDYARQNNAAIYNCSFLPIDSITAIAEILWLSISGCGVGFSVESHNINKLPIIKHNPYNLHLDYVIDDTSEDWFYSTLTLLAELFNGCDVHFDYSQIRLAGVPLRTKGGYASGPQVLQDIHNDIRNWILLAQGRKLTSIEVHDICTRLADAGISGGVRRAAMISFFDETDHSMLKAKSGDFYKTHPWRANANNSVILMKDHYEKEELDAIMSNLWENGSGEPGIIFPKNLITRSPEWRKFEYGTEQVRMNPCQPSFATVLTPDGIKTFADINVGSLIWSEDGWVTVTKKWSNGIKSVNQYNSSFGVFIGTENHRVLSNGEKIEVKDSEQIDALAGQNYICQIDSNSVMSGLLIGDGMIHKASNNKIVLLIGENDKDYFNSEISNLILKHRFGITDEAYEVETNISIENLLLKTYERVVPNEFLFSFDVNKVASFLRGLFSANGSVVSNRIQLKQSSYKLIQQVQLMLSSLGIRSYISINLPKYIEFDNGIYKNKESYNLQITKDRGKFYSMIGFIQKYKMNKITPSNNDKLSSGIIQSIEYLGEYEVFDITVDGERHTYWSGGLNVSNCAEIILEGTPVEVNGGGGEFCNLSAVICKPNDTLDTLLHKTKIATLIGDIQSLATNFPVLRAEWKNKCKKDRLLGVNHVGHAVCAELRNPDTQIQLRKQVEHTDKWFSKIFNVVQSAAQTSSKPSGNTTVLYNTGPGINPVHEEYSLRNVTVNKSTVMYDFLFMNSVPYLELDNKEKVVFSFPYKAPDNAIILKDVSAREQCEYWKQVTLTMMHHNASCSIIYKPEEIEELKEWVYQNQNIIGGQAFFPYFEANYPYLPIFAITKEQYEKAIKEFPKINWETFYKYERGIDEHTFTLECSSDRCDIGN